MKKISGIIFFIAVLSTAHSQNTILDSLNNVLSTATNDTSRVFTLLRISLTYYYSKPDSAMYFAQQAHTIAKDAGFSLGQSQSLAIVGNLFSSTGNYIKALEAQFQVLELQEKEKDTFGIAATYNNMALVYEEQEDYNNAIAYYRKAKEYFNAKNSKSNLLIILLNMGNGYEKLNRLDSALFYQNQAHELALAIKDTDNMGLILSNMGNIHLKLNKHDTALSYYRSSIPYALNINDKPTLSEAKFGIAKIFKERDKIDSSIFYAKEALTYSTESSNPRGVANASVLLSDLYETKKKFDSAYWYQKKATNTKDTIFNAEIVRNVQIMSTNEQLRKKEVIDARARYLNKIRWIISLSALIIAILLAIVFYRSNKHKKTANAMLQLKNNQIERALIELKQTQAQLIQSAKMASLGELTAGIAHEIQNPLNFVNNFSETNVELLEELVQNAQSWNLKEVLEVANNIKENEKKVNQHGQRADAIVKSMLEHSRSSKGERQLTDLNVLIDEYLRLAYHGFRAKDKSFNANIETRFDSSIGKISIVPQDIGRVMLNMFNNAFYAVNDKRKQANGSYEPLVSVSSKMLSDSVNIIVKDNGTGIPQGITDKIFQPFFTTKPTGQGTGLGLSLSYDIVRTYNGDLKVESTEGEGTTFIISLPT